MTPYALRDTPQAVTAACRYLRALRAAGRTHFTAKELCAQLEGFRLDVRLQELLRLLAHNNLIERTGIAVYSLPPMKPGASQRLDEMAGIPTPPPRPSTTIWADADLPGV